jgi:threonine dehydrogenase-like Zn-dependent dehydrogenase
MATDRGYDEPRPKKSNTLWYVLGGIAIGVLVLCCLPCGGMSFWFYYQNNQKEQRVANEPGMQIGATQLNTEYQNPTAAHAKYFDKVLVVNGKVTSKNLTGVTLDNAVDAVGAATANNEALNKLNVGDTVTVKGICQDKPFGNTIQLANARIAK